MIYLIGEPLADHIQGALLRGRLDEMLKLSAWALKDETDVEFYRWFSDRRWRIYSEFNMKPATFVMNSIRTMGWDGRLERLLGGPIRFIDVIGKKGVNVSLARRTVSGKIIEIHPNIREFARRVGANRSNIGRRVLNAERFRLRYPKYEPHAYVTAHKYRKNRFNDRPNS